MLPVAMSRSPSPSTSPVAVAGVAVAGVNTSPALKPPRVVWSNRKMPGDREGRADGERRVLDLDAEELARPVSICEQQRTERRDRQVAREREHAGRDRAGRGWRRCRRVVICSAPLRLAAVMFMNVPSVSGQAGDGDVDALRVLAERDRRRRRATGRRSSADGPGARDGERRRGAGGVEVDLEGAVEGDVRDVDGDRRR